jgi:hypothetical protein
MSGRRPVAAQYPDNTDDQADNNQQDNQGIHLLSFTAMSFETVTIKQIAAFNYLKEQRLSRLPRRSACALPSLLSDLRSVLLRRSCTRLSRKPA